MVVIPFGRDGAIDLKGLDDELGNPKYTKRQKICSFSAGSNITGIRTRVYDIARIGHAHDALVFFDFAAVAERRFEYHAAIDTLGQCAHVTRRFAAADFLIRVDEDDRDDGRLHAGPARCGPGSRVQRGQPCPSRCQPARARPPAGRPASAAEQLPQHVLQDPAVAVQPT